MAGKRFKCIRDIIDFDYKLHYTYTRFSKGKVYYSSGKDWWYLTDNFMRTACISPELRKYFIRLSNKKKNFREDSKNM